MKRGIAAVTTRMLSLAVAAAACLPAMARAQALVDPALTVSTVVTGLSQPISMAFLGPNDFLVTEKATGQVKRVIDALWPVWFSI